MCVNIRGFDFLRVGDRNHVCEPMTVKVSEVALQRPRMRRGKVARDGARAHAAHVERAGSLSVGHGQDDEGFGDVDGDGIIIQAIV
jgi:hypothetical protein